MKWIFLIFFLVVAATLGAAESTTEGASSSSLSGSLIDTTVKPKPTPKESGGLFGILGKLLPGK